MAEARDAAQEAGWLTGNAAEEEDSAGIHTALDDPYATDKSFSFNSWPDINGKFYGQTPLKRACDDGNLPLIRTLILNGADANIADGRKLTPLHAACVISTDDQYKIVETMLTTHPERFPDEGKPQLFIKPDLNLKREDTGQTCLHTACFHGKLNIVRLLVKHNETCLSSEDNQNMTPLETACLRGHYYVVEYLLRYWTRIPKTQSQNSICYAIKGGHTEIVRIILGMGLEVNAKGKDDNTFLHYACLYSRHEIAALLIARGADVNATNTRLQTPLHLLGEDDASIVTLLIENGASTDAQDNQGMIPFLQSCVQGHAHCVTELVARHGTQVSNGNPLFQAVERGQCKTVEKLIKNQTNVNKQRATDSKAPLHIACEKEDTELVKVLLEHGACTNIRSAMDLKTPLHSACQNNNVDIVRMLLEKDANVHVKTLSQQTPLHFACENNSLGMARLLIEKGAVVNVRRAHDFLTPLHMACRNNNTEIVEMLLDKEAAVGVHCAPDLLAPLHIACRNNNTKIVEMLLQKGARVIATEAHGQTPLHYACQNNNLEMVRLLLQKGAKAAVPRMGDMMMPLHIACENNNQAIAKTVRERRRYQPNQCQPSITLTYRL